MTGNVGPNAVKTLAAAGVEVFLGQNGTVREALERYRDGALQSTSTPNVADHYGMGDSTGSSGTSGGGMDRGMGRGMGRGIQGVSPSSTIPASGTDEVNQLKDQVRQLREQVNGLESKLGK